MLCENFIFHTIFYYAYAMNDMKGLVLDFKEVDDSGYNPRLYSKS